MLREIKGSVERTNGHLDRVGHVLDSVGGIVGRVERLTGLIEHAAASPIMKFISVGAGVKKAAESFGKKKSKSPAGAGLDGALTCEEVSGSRSAWAPARPAPFSPRGGRSAKRTR